MTIPAQEQFVEDVGTPGLNRSSVEPWLAANLPGYTSPGQFQLIAAGGSNLTYLVTDRAGTRFVLRRPPVGDRLATAHDVVREGRIISGLESTDIPVPKCLGVCEDQSVCNAPFVVLSYEEGWILRDEETARLLGEDGCRRAGMALFETLAALHLLDPADAGLGELSKPDAYVERQLLRWSRQVEQITIEPHPLFRELHGRLLAAAPDGRETGGSHLVHGDFHIDNAVFDRCFEVRALLDWELSTLGDPIADLAWALMFWSESPDEPVRPARVITTAPGFPTRAEVTERYQSVSGFDISALSYYEAFSFWKIACLMQGSLHRAMTGGGGGLQQSRAADPREAADRIARVFEAAGDAASRARI